GVKLVSHRQYTPNGPLKFPQAESCLGGGARLLNRLEHEQDGRSRDDDGEPYDGQDGTGESRTAWGAPVADEKRTHGVGALEHAQEQQETVVGPPEGLGPAVGDEGVADVA